MYHQFTFHYASTLSQLTGGSRIDISIYIPLCFYFIRWIPIIVYICNIIYIPLCFYFIGVTHGKNPQVIADLHSTMLLLYHPKNTLNKMRQLHLHSTMLLLYLPLITSERFPIDIYIPLCFYFIANQQLVMDTGTHLHSTMLLLYRSQLIYVCFSS